MDLYIGDVSVATPFLKAKLDADLVLISSVISFVDLTIFVGLAIQACKQMHLHTDLKSLIQLGFGRLNNRLWVSLNGLIPQASVKVLLFNKYRTKRLRVFRDLKLFLPTSFGSTPGNLGSRYFTWSPMPSCLISSWVTNGADLPKNGRHFVSPLQKEFKGRPISSRSR